ncbi:hypothetical protein AT728_07200 [Streptomyces silvensis]|uniref:Uncharacterized protein n=1 Tax=Streptomyces silvensis TaxID=1765722 RepID=A0A0W7X7K8_9ACTN|nr:hypothetical protein AT728_07200 [Streptomyces silvensis]
MDVRGRPPIDTLLQEPVGGRRAATLALCALRLATLLRLSPPSDLRQMLSGHTLRKPQHFEA